MKHLQEKKNIALVHDWITNVSGAERVLIVLKELFPSAPIYTSVYDAKNAFEFEEYDIRTSYLQKVPFAKKRQFLVPYAPQAFESFDFSSYDVVISSTTMPAKGIITRPDTKHICYCHTPARYLWEPRLDPRSHGGRFKKLKRDTSHRLRIWDRLAVDRVDHFIANSEYIAKRIKKYYRRDAEVVYPPVDVDFFSPDGEGRHKDYFLFVSRLVGYKRCDLVIEAFNRLGLPLIVIGRGPERKRLKSLANDNIRFLGFISDDELKKYYREAKAFVFAAEEDFGIVPVEAMASGRPVIAYGAGGAKETVVKGLTGEFFDQQTPESLIQVLENFNPNKYDIDEIRKHSEKFSIENFKKKFMKKIEKLLKE